MCNHKLWTIKISVVTHIGYKQAAISAKWWVVGYKPVNLVLIQPFLKTSRGGDHPKHGKSDQPPQIRLQIFQRRAA